MVAKPRLAASAFALAVLAAAPANAQGIIDSMLGLVGLRPQSEAPEIDYRERAPLVVPPEMKLRPPEAPPASRSAAWPNDPDVARRAAEAKAAKTPRPNARELEIGDGMPRRPGDIPGGRIASTNAPVEQGRNSERGLSQSGWMHPDQMRAMGGSMKTNSNTGLVAGQEPPRRYLTDPPTGLRVPSDRGPLTAGRSLARPALSDKEAIHPLNTYRPKPKNPDDE